MCFIRFRYLLLISLLTSTGCAPAPSKSLPRAIFPKAAYPIHQYPFSINVEGIEVAAVPYAPGKNIFANPNDSTDGQTYTILNIVDTGVQPVRLIIWNKSRDIVSISPSQIFGLADSAAYFLYPPADAVNLVVQSNVFKEALKGSELGQLAESLLGSTAFLSGVALGLPGLTIGGAMAILNEPADVYAGQLKQLISKVFKETALKEFTLYPEQLIHGVVFLPSHSKIRTLRIVGAIPVKQESVLIEIDFGEGLP